MGQTLPNRQDVRPNLVNAIDNTMYIGQHVDAAGMLRDLGTLGFLWNAMDGPCLETPS